MSTGWHKKACKNVELVRDLVGVFGSDALIPVSATTKIKVNEEDGLEAKVLHLPLVAIGNWGMEISNNYGQWELGPLHKYIRPAVIFNCRFCLMANEDTTDEFKNATSQFVLMLNLLLGRRGVYLEKKANRFHDFRSIRHICELVTDEKITFLVIIGADKDVQEHAKISEVLIGVPIQVVPDSIFTEKETNFDDLVQETVHLINLKAGGTVHGLGTTSVQKSRNFNELGDPFLNPNTVIDRDTDFHMSFFRKTMVIGYEIGLEKTKTTVDRDVKLPEMETVGYAYTGTSDANVIGGGYFYSKSPGPFSSKVLKKSIWDALTGFKNKPPYKYPQRLMVYLRQGPAEEAAGDVSTNVKAVEDALEQVCVEHNVQPIGLLVLSVQHPSGLSFKKADTEFEAGICYQKREDEFWLLPCVVRDSEKQLIKVKILVKKEFDVPNEVIQQATLNLCCLNERLDRIDTVPAPLSCASHFAERGIFIYNSQIHECHEDYDLEAPEFEDYDLEATNKFAWTIKSGYVS